MWTTDCNVNVNAATAEGDKTMEAFLKDTVRKQDVEKENRNPSDIVKERTFSLIYLIECLISRGAVVKDQLLLDKVVWIDFLTVLSRCYREAREVCLYSLERLITMIDERKRLGSLVMAFLNEYEAERDRGVSSTLSWQEIKDGYRKVRKLVITQTRVIYVVPEVIMANRVIRRYDHDGTRIIRVTFRDDDNQTMRVNKTSKYLIVDTLRRVMTQGLLVANRWFGYLGSSNSQMRDSGAYFMEKFSRKAHDTYVMEYGCEPPPTWQPKIDGARESLGRKEYTFSDGVGMISYTFAKQIANDMLLDNCVPSCFQFRFRGMKGVLAVNKLLDEFSKWAKKYDIEPPQRKFGSWDLRMIFRPSQTKFNAKRTACDSLEVVKYSAPVPVALNKPFICILDQVSGMQSYDCHARVTNRIEELLDIQLRGFGRTMLREHDCRNKLKELPRRVDIDRLSMVSGFQLSTEPFFRSLIKATIKYSITKQMRKQQIQIPFDKGRSMLGVVDETGQLQSGQIFVQYTENIHLKTPPPKASRKVLTGTVLLTKNPCVVAGDVRIFEAVDIPELHDLCDVVVFPMHGPRSHPDEMAGSDLDGDEYSVIWDQELLLDRNEAPFDYTADKPETKPINRETMNSDMVDFYIKYITQDSVGTISNSFLFQADLYGLNSEVCLRLAKKISQAVDFTKTGLPPQPLVKDWTEDEETGKEIPPEKSERQPDFHFGNDYEPTYRSARLMGSIYREIKAIEDVLRISEDLDEQDPVECDSYLMVDGWTRYREVAEAQLSKYKGRMRAIMENYGIKSEGEIFSGCICEMRNRISDKDQDDMSFYNTNEVIEKKVTSLFREYREEFFQEFGGWQGCTRLVAKKFAIEENIFHRYVQHPSLEMQQKAVAYYRVCYETAQQTLERILSFAWLAYDVLALVKQERIINEENHIPAATPLYEMLKNRISSFCEKNLASFYSFADNLSGEAKQPIVMYMNHYTGLRRMMFIVCEWAARNRLLLGRLQSHHVCLILILYATGQLQGSLNRQKPFLEEIEGSDVNCENPEDIDDDSQMEIIVAFFEYLASRAFRKLPHISFDTLGYACVFLRGEWIPMHETAVKTYYNMVFNLKFDELDDNVFLDPSRSLAIRESEPFVIELPERADILEVTDRIKEKTGVDEVSLRRLPCRQEGRVAVSARGTVQSLRMLKDLVTVKPLIKTAARGKEISDQLCRLVYENIMRH
ncbi:RNA dependent RNA polymerase [Oesophagostomum dentatum]|uniref:RNA-dependent RNA polymerase n=1 Tax=Oesophagostomum dentatum TaxID=61180 RepID=A0A0B1T9H5_OESDE|nr:RNA dependent RNA polymerase [Oesophagostomum dentatum]